MKKRILNTVAWEDPLAWTERMSGPKWNALLADEKKRFDEVFRKYVNPVELQRIADELSVAGVAQMSEPYTINLDVQVWDLGTLSVLWKWTSTEDEHSAAECAFDNDSNAWDIVDSGEGAETYTLRYWPYHAKQPSWELKGVGPYVIVLDGRCFFLKAKQSLWYSTLCTVDAKSGKDMRVLYEEKDPLWNLSLVRGENHTGYLIREDSGLQQAFFFHNASSLRKLPVSGFFVLGGGAPNDYFATEGRGTDSWKGYGPRLSRWHLPSNAGIPESVYPHKKLLVTRSKAERFLWLCSTLHPPKLLKRCLGQIHFNRWGMFHQDDLFTLRVVEPGSYTTLCFLDQEALACIPAHIAPYGHATREVSGKVPYILVKPTSGPVKSLLVTGYGAYGMSSSLDTTRWVPLLKRGWAVAIALVRGGGDDTMEWADAARTWKRESSIQDFLDVIKAAQKKVSVSAKHTMVYGRSAGGLLIGAAAAKQKKLDYFAGLYGEVPYLDVLRTTTNPHLPLTQMEYNEFGNPGQRLEDLITIGRISPMEGIPPTGYPGLFALLRTGSNDQEVFAYEPVKWILKARGKVKDDSSKLLAFEKEQGHFVGGSTGRQNRADDLAILLAWRQFGSLQAKS